MKISYFMEVDTYGRTYEEMWKVLNISIFWLSVRTQPFWVSLHFSRHQILMKINIESVKCTIWDWIIIELKFELLTRFNWWFLRFQPSFLRVIYEKRWPIGEQKRRSGSVGFVLLAGQQAWTNNSKVSKNNVYRKKTVELIDSRLNLNVWNKILK